MLILTLQPKTVQQAVEPVGVKVNVVPVSGVCIGFQVCILYIFNTSYEGIGSLLFRLF